MEGEISGILAAIFAQLFMAIGFVVWDKTWNASGGSAFALNLYKCNLASIGFLIAAFIFGFTTIADKNEIESSPYIESVGYLILSGFIGIIVGDLAWLEALRQIGAARVLIIDTLKPFSAALFGWLLLDESIHKVAFSGIAFTVVGILIVGLENERGGGDSELIADDEEVQSPSPDENNGDESDDQKQILSNSSQDDKYGDENEDQKQKLSNATKEDTNTSTALKTKSIWDKRRGYALAIGNIFLDTWGSVLTKQHGSQFTTWSINLVRFGSAGLFMIVVSSLMRIYERLRVARNQQENGNITPWYRLPKLNWNGWLKISVGVLFVTFCCPALSNYALFKIALALALTLGSITPMYALFLEWMFYGASKKPTLRAIGGASLAIVGVVILGLFNK